jgi:hypothetical protein
MSIFGNSGHFEWMATLSDTILKRDHPRTIPVKFALIWFSGFRERRFKCDLLSKYVQFVMSSNFNCRYMTMRRLTYIPGFSVKFFFQPIYADYTNWTYFDKRSHLNLLSLKSLNQIKPDLAGIVLG